jgi:hypothetical protein
VISPWRHISLSGHIGLRTTAAQTEAAGKRQFLSYLTPNLIIQTKVCAIQHGMTASVVVQMALTEFLTRAGAGEIVVEAPDISRGG